MGLLDADWVKTHKRMCNQYEDLAIRNFERDPSQQQADVHGIIAEIIQHELPQLSREEAQEFVHQQYIAFNDFEFDDKVAELLRVRNPVVEPDLTAEIHSRLRRAFHRKEREHEYFLFFVISKVIELRQMSISRIEYMLEIARGRIPRNSRIVAFLRTWRHIAHYSMAKQREAEANKHLEARSK